MHGRQRNFGNGYRSGFGMSASRISPDRPRRGHGFFGSDHHHQQQHHRGGFNRGYGRGRGRSKSFQNQLPPPLPPPAVQRRSIGGSGDVFMDAGRLAAEYLVSQGVLPQNVLSGKWQGGGEFQGGSSRLQEAARVDVLPPAAEKRRYADGYAGSRNSLQGRRGNRYESEFGRSGSWSERSKGYEAETGDDSVSGHREEQPLVEDIASSVQRSASGEFMRKREGAGDSESVLDKDEAQSKTGSSSAGKEIVQDCEISKVSEGSCSLSAGSGDMIGRNGGNGGENESQNAVEDAPIHQHGEDAPIHKHCDADESFTESGIDLATLCKFEKVPTRMRSSLTAKNTKLHLSQNIKETSHNPGLLEEDQACETRGQSSGKADNTGDESFNDQVENLPVENSKCPRSNSFPNSILRENKEKDSELELPNIHRSYSMGKGGQKRANEGSDMEEGAKRQKNWVSLPVSEASDGFNAFKASEIQSDEEEEEKPISFYMRLIDGGAGKTDNHESLANKGNDSIQSGKSGHGYAEEHQLFPASFKMCDLNLGGASNGNDGKREPGQAVGFDLSISSSSKPIDFSTNTRMSNGKEIEVIDLDNDDSPEVVKSGRKQEAGPYMGIDDVPDYNEGLMMVEYLDSFGNIPPINPGVSTTVPQNNDVALQDQREGALGNEQAANNTDDDSIFMSLGEIPLTFLQTWDQPPARGYEKPF
ncbi:Uncharacterized protein Rs2_13394 [Raphanus sativus]|uniref:Uncharacterized protein At4g26450-like n=1 Tax=Raphanus sativus TaxID=3726 RepID=A0A9W3DIA9_RAPSA|nr:uncharacterized protein At4g26450-like [Raphanus sativus]XP_056863173.1 uncharacterized protein At4g26450-like [Raphanus sativus]KAJ4899443.1 Uncharacterized protein Rs2_13394 [Raphanus sativus]